MLDPIGRDVNREAEAKCGCCRRPQQFAKSAGTNVTF
jgi:hypothetical protein